LLDEKALGDCMACVDLNPVLLKDYLELVDWTGRAILENKRGYIPDQQSPILERLQVDPKHWLYMTQNFSSSVIYFQTTIES
jgi:hypothetical protein